VSAGDPKVVAAIYCPSNPGTVLGGYRCKATRTGAGAWTIITEEGFDANMFVQYFPNVQIRQAAGVFPASVDAGANAGEISVTTYDNAHLAADQPFWFTLTRVSRTS
jgi:hypothetical protein